MEFNTQQTVHRAVALISSALTMGRITGGYHASTKEILVRADEFKKFMDGSR